MSEERETLSIKPREPSANDRAELAKQDWLWLMKQPQFLRTLFTIFETMGMYTGNYRADGRTHAFLEGRRSSGLDILRTAEAHLGPDAHLRILEAEKLTLKGTPNGRRTSTDIDRDDDGDDLRAAGTGLVYLDYD